MGILEFGILIRGVVYLYMRKDNEDISVWIPDLVRGFTVGLVYNSLSTFAVGVESWINYVI